MPPGCVALGLRTGVALGPWSGQPLRRFGLRFPMVHKRGCHPHDAGQPLDFSRYTKSH